jgi:hypoxanthine phosphoribosyltransferase
MQANEEIIVKDIKFKKYIQEDEIKQRVLELAEQISKDYVGKKPVLLLTLKGAIIFAADLMREISIPVRVETIIAKSYGLKMNSSNEVELIENPADLKDRDVVIIEDIVDTGFTMKSLIERLKTFEPKSIEICTLLFKPKNLQIPIDVKYVGFSIEPLFVVGYGLDYAECGRNLKSIYIKSE